MIRRQLFMPVTHNSPLHYWFRGAGHYETIMSLRSHFTRHFLGISCIINTFISCRHIVIQFGRIRFFFLLSHLLCNLSHCHLLFITDLIYLVDLLSKKIGLCLIYGTQEYEKTLEIHREGMVFEFWTTFLLTHPVFSMRTTWTSD